MVGGAKEIRTQILSIKSTQKITSAMSMVAASKMRKTQERKKNSTPYAERIRRIVGYITHPNAEYKHTYMTERKIKRVGFIIVSTDLGLCGGLNINLFKKVIASMSSATEQGTEIDLGLIGEKSIRFFRSYGGNVIAATKNIGDLPSMTDLIGGIKVMLDKYEVCDIDRLYVVYNQFVNTMIQSPVELQLLPIVPNSNQESLKKLWNDYIYEPDAKKVLDGLLVRYIESQVFQAVVENKACEQAARMIAMKKATDNSGDLIDDLKLLYNKARQATITQELSEIVSGAAAV